MNAPKPCVTGDTTPGHQRGRCRACQREYARAHMRRKRAGEPIRPYGVYGATPSATDILSDEAIATAITAALNRAINLLCRYPSALRAAAVRGKVSDFAAALRSIEAGGRAL